MVLTSKQSLTELPYLYKVCPTVHDWVMVSDSWSDTIRGLFFWRLAPLQNVPQSLSLYNRTFLLIVTIFFFWPCPETEREREREREREIVTASYTLSSKVYSVELWHFWIHIMFSGTVFSLEMSYLSINIFSLWLLLVNPWQTPVLMLV